MRRAIILILLTVLIIAGVLLFETLQKPKAHDAITLFGNVDVRQVELGFRVEGRVNQMFFQEGDLVPQGKLMATLDKQPYIDQMLQAKANVESINHSFLNAETTLKRRADLIIDGSVSQEDYENALSSKDVFAANLKAAQAALGVAITNLNDTEMHAPSEGTILTRIREPGTIVRVSDPIYTLSLLSPVWVRAFVAEPDLGLVYPGMPAEVYTDTLGSKVYKGHVGFISPSAEFTPKTVETTQLRTSLVYRLRIIADNPDQGLRQGMPVTVKLLLKKDAAAEEKQ